MIEVILTILIILTFSSIAESISTYLFGKPHTSFLLTLETFLFIFLFIAIVQLIYNNQFFYIILAFVTFTLQILVRGLTTFFGKYGVKETIKVSEEEKILIKLIENLKREKIRKDKIEKILENSGFKKWLIEKYL